MQITNLNFQMDKKQTKRPYNLEERTLQYTKDIISLVNKIPKSLSNIEIAKQLIRSAGSVGANYIEANESLGKKDFVMHARIARKEGKESRYWLQLLECDEYLQSSKGQLIQESTELLKICNCSA
jgi:four helix bundle protein